MKLLVFEYICGGGLAGQVLPVSLLAEGRLMLQALLDELKSLSDIQVLLPLDVRCQDLNLPANVEVFAVTAADDHKQVLNRLLLMSDALWPIAPETDAILAGLAKQAVDLQKTLLLSDPETVALCTDKLATYQRLKAYGIPVVESLSLLDVNALPFATAVLKPRDGVGCEGNYIVFDQAQFQSVSQSIRAENYLVQPLLAGDAVSLSCLFKKGHAWLLTINQQQILIQNHRFCLQACDVNTYNSQREFYLDLIQRVALAMPGLWGYIGIDLLETAEFGPLILEINPRLTTSYAGIRPATGINVAEQVLRLIDSEPDLSMTNPHSVRITIHQMIMQTAILGWDIGGAHVKAALLNSDGEVVCVLQQPCPLWKGLIYLEQAVDKILAALPAPCPRHAVTMTGELVDCFSSREQGVMAIIQTLQAKLGSVQIDVFAGTQGFLPADKVQATEVMAIASANWIASAQLAAKRQPQALFVDIGSTTTDILLIAAHQLRVVGLTDYARLVSGELLYTGIVRTAVMAVAQRAEFNGHSMGLMAEYFATMADVYRVTGDLQEQHDQSDTADGAEKTAEASAIRLSRMTGYEFTAEEWPLWRAFAHTLKQQQLANIKQACIRQLQRSMRPKQTCIVGAGVGRFLAKQLATELNLPYVDFSELIVQATSLGELDAADCAPAVAVAFLAGGFG